MIKVLIVDDEVPIREWLEHCVSKIGQGYQVAGHARNGEEAMELIHQLKPDVVMTDITMPKKDGIELLKEIQRENLPIDVIMLTCHSDFDYARLAIKHGASDYILKSEISFESVVKILKDAEARITAKKRLISESEKTSHNITRSYFLRSLADGAPGQAVSLEILRNNQIDLDDQPLVAIAFHYQDELIDKIKTFIMSWRGKRVFFEYRDNLIILISNLDPTIGPIQQTQQISQLVEMIGEESGGTVGSSSICQHIACLQKSIQEAVNMRAMLFYLPPEALPAAEWPDPEQELSAKNQILKKIGEIIEGVKSFENQKVRQIIEILFEQVAQARILDIGFIKRHVTDLLEKISGYVSSLKLNVNDVRKDILEIDELIDLKDYVLGVCGYLDQANVKYSENIAAALQYINKHYMDQIKLSDVAELVYLNDEYFSRLFKKEVGVNFSKYLTNLRMEHAKRLLKTTNLSVSEVANQVGIPNQSYFTIRFKNHFNKLPHEMQGDIRPESK